MNQETENTNQNRTGVPIHADVEHVQRPQAAVRSQQAVSIPVVTPQDEAVDTKAGDLILPSSVVSRSDISKSLRELEILDDFFHQASVRGSKDQTMPTLGRVLDSLAVANNLNLIHAEDRSSLKTFLTRLKARAPVVHMSFPSEASGPFLAKILEWFRQEVHPHTVLHVGLQPELVAGCMVRTTNKQYDFSFRKKFEKSKEKLITALESSSEAALLEEPTEAPATEVAGSELNSQPEAQPVTTGVPS